MTAAKPTITTQPKSVTVALGATASFKVVASGTGLQYQWQYKKSGATSWTDWSGKTAATLTVTASSTNGGCQYRCVVSNTAGSVTSSAATLTVTGSTAKPTITTQPKSVSVTLGTTTTFQVVASGSGLKYQWQYSKNNGASWTDWSGMTAATLSVKASATNNGCLYRCKVSTTAGSVTSSAATLTVTGSTAKPTITTQPKSVTVAIGAAATFKVVASGTGLQYQWQYKKSGATSWTDWSGKTAATLTVTASSTNGGCQYRCKVSNAGGSVTSSAATLTVTAAKPTITTQPKSVSVALGSTATFKVVASGSGLKYQWQYKKSGATSWTSWSGKTAATLTVTASSTNGGCQYRCKVSNAGGTVYSSAATLTVTGSTAKPTITTQPKSVSVTLGTTTTFKVVASGSGLKYQWQYSKNNGASWTDWSGMTAATLSVKASATNNGCLYRCKVSNAGGSVTSSNARLTVSNVKPTILVQPKAASVALGSTTTMKVVAAGSGLTYQWQYRKDNGSTWKNWSGKTAATLSITGSSTNNGCLYRCVVKNSYGSVTTSSAKLTVT